MKRQEIDWEKITMNYILEKGLISRIGKEPLKLNKKQTSESSFKNGQKISTDTLPRRYIQMAN